MPLLQILLTSTRPGRSGDAVARWFEPLARDHGAFDVEFVDLAAVNLPLFDEPRHPRLQQYEHEHTKRWSQIVQRADAFVIVTPEYNHTAPPALVNALDFLVHEWAYTAAGFVSYGGVSGGLRSVQSIKPMLTGLKVMPIPEAVTLPFFSQHLDKDAHTFDPPEVQVKAAHTMLDELKRWTDALAPLRATKRA